MLTSEEIKKDIARQTNLYAEGKFDSYFKYCNDDIKVIEGIFNRAWKQLTEKQKALPRKAIKNLITDMRYPALRIKKIKGTENIWEARVSRSLRMTFHVETDTIILRNVGQHDETLERP